MACYILQDNRLRKNAITRYVRGFLERKYTDLKENIQTTVAQAFMPRLVQNGRRHNASYR